MTVRTDEGIDADLARVVAAAGASAARAHRGNRTWTLCGSPDGAADLRVERDGVALEVWGDVPEPLVAGVAGCLARIGALGEERAGLTEALVETNDRLLALYELSRLRLGSLDRAEMVTTILTDTVRLTRAGVALARTGDGDVDIVVGAHGGGGGEVDTTDELAAWLGSAAARFDDDGGAGVRSVGNLARHGIVCRVELDGGDHAVVGVAREPVPFETGDHKLVDAVGSTIGGALSLAALHEETMGRALVEREHDTASRLAQAVLAAPLPALGGIELFARSSPARTAGGDLFTFTANDGALRFAVGDVAGKGLPAALIMTRVITVSQAAFLRHRPDDVAATAADVSAELYDYLSDAGLFTTVLVGAHVPGSGEVHLCNAGHSPAMVITRDGVRSIRPSGPPIGVLPGIGGTEVVTVAEGDLLVVGSDGLTEQEDGAGEMFGQARLEAVLRGAWGEPAATVGATVLDEVERHAAGTAAADDRTLCVLRIGETRSDRTT
ncbi:MAG: SpoIIE family protein phosphatase [Actinomycetota bacterium]|nr:SpoIIE family protein phosphatase [Actinomycetota bacterium]